MVAGKAVNAGIFGGQSRKIDEPVGIFKKETGAWVAYGQKATTLFDEHSGEQHGYAHTEHFFSTVPIFSYIIA